MVLGVGGQEDCGERETGAGGEIRRIEDADWNLDAETRRLRLDLDLGEGKPIETCFEKCRVVHLCTVTMQISRRSNIRAAGCCITYAQ